MPPSVPSRTTSHALGLRIARSRRIESATPVHSALPTAPSPHCTPFTFRSRKSLLFPAHSKVTGAVVGAIVMSCSKLIANGFSTSPSMYNHQASRSIVGIGKRVRTKNDFVGVIKLSSVENGISRFSGLSLRTILPSRSFVSSCGICSGTTISVHGGNWKPFRPSSSGHGNRVLRNFVHFELVRRHPSESKAQRNNPLQQLLTVAVHQVSRQNSGVKRVHKN